MTSRWRLALFASALALVLLGSPRRAEARKSLKDCPVYQALTSQRRAGDGNRSVKRYRNTGRKSHSVLGQATSGVKNMVLAPIEIPLTMRRVAAEKNIVAGLVVGPLQGVGNGLYRLVGGATELVTAPVPGLNPSRKRGVLRTNSKSEWTGGDILANVLSTR